MTPKRKFKLSFICHEYPPIGAGASTALEAVTDRLANLGHQIQVLTIGPKGGETYPQSPNKEVISLADCRKNTFCPTYLELLMSYFSIRYKAPKYLRNFKPNAVISFFAFPAGHAVRSFLKAENIPHVISIRGADAPKFHDHQFFTDHLLIPLLVKKVIRECQAVYANGLRLKKLVEDNIKGTVVKNIPNGVDQLSNHSTQLRAHEPLRIIFVGQLISRKRIEEALKGIQLFASQTQKNIEFTIVGAGFLEETLRTLACRSPKNLKVIFKGYMNRDEIKDLYKKQHIMVHLSRYEGLSNTLLEGFANGLGLLVSKDMMVEFSDEEEREFPGIILSQYTPENIANALGDMLKLESQMNTYANRSINLAHKFSWETHINELLAIVDKVA